ncbi:MAG: hypothetical protein PHT44_01675 [Candidatus Portnoybacteria bacterium]|nr:hypothetical protein [Candidatus Portnoybacteria bacterium]MDD4982695.1 hypothetical protein [Candidatus Portnoybacteria bacterium]
MLTPLQQAIDLIQKSKNILIALPESLNADSLGSALALEATLKKLGKKVELASQEAAPDKLAFLPGIDALRNKLTSLRDFVISVDTSQNKISRLRYEAEGSVLKIFLATPQKIEQRDIKLEPGPFYYDLIIVIDAPDLESLGDIFNSNTELFFNKSILNIDCKAGNEYFGEVNLVEPTAAACAEIVVGLIEGLAPNSIDANIATLLLAGLIVKTHSWQNSRTTPQALNLASLLIIKGAEQETIVKNLYKTKPLNCLKLWGRLLGRLEFDDREKIAWIFAQREDFIATGTSAKDLPFVLDEIYDLFPSINLAIILWPDDNGSTYILAQSKRAEHLQKLCLEIGGSVKNDRLLVKMAGMAAKDAKEKIAVLLNSLS